MHASLLPGYNSKSHLRMGARETLLRSLGADSSVYKSGFSSISFVSVGLEIGHE